MKVSNKPLRDRFLAGSFDRRELAIRCGWFKTNREGKAQVDLTTLDRYLGLAPLSDGGPTKDLISEDKALLLAEALLMDPHEIGL